MNQQSSPDTIARLVIALGEAFGRKVTETTVNAYRIGLSGLSEDELQQAGAEALQRCEFMPPPARLRELVRGTSDHAQQAWLVVEGAFGIGSYRHVDFQDKSINAAIRSLGGWPQLFERCATTEGESIYRAQFLKAYAAIVGHVSTEAGRPLTGLSEANSVQRDDRGEVISYGVHVKRIACAYLQPQTKIGATNGFPALPASTR